MPIIEWSHSSWSAPSSEPFPTVTVLLTSTAAHKLTRKHNTFIDRKWAKPSPQMKPVDCTLRALPALKIAHAAPGNESWHCKLASWPVLPNLAVDTIDAGWWAAGGSILHRTVGWKVCIESIVNLYQRLDCVVSSCLLSINIWIICLDSRLTEDVHEMCLYTDRSKQFRHLPLFYSLSTSYSNKYLLSSSLFHSALKCISILFPCCGLYLPATKVNNDLATLKCK